YGYVNGDPVNLVDPDGHSIAYPDKGCTTDECEAGHQKNAEMVKTGQLNPSGFKQYLKDLLRRRPLSSFGKPVPAAVSDCSVLFGVQLRGLTKKGSQPFEPPYASAQGNCAAQLAEFVRVETPEGSFVFPTLRLHATSKGGSGGGSGKGNDEEEGAEGAEGVHRPAAQDPKLENHIN